MTRSVLGRRAVIGGGAGLGRAAAGAGGFLAGRDDAGGRAASYPFRGTRQAGIVTPSQDRLHFAAFDVTTERREDLVALLEAWTSAAERMTRGWGAGPVGAVAGSREVAPDDTGEALDLPPSGLTMTFGFGPGLFDGRFGLAGRRPEALADLPHFPGDTLDAARSGGDLCVQACADDPQVAVHAIRNLARIGFGTVSVRWSQLGFGRTSTTSRGQSTPRNLFGFKDGTANLKAEDNDALAEHVWVARGESPGDWLAGGSYLVARRIAMEVEVWDRQPLGDQEEFVGRTKGQGGPLSGGTEHAAVVPTRLPPDSHVRVVHPSAHGGVRILRRGYNFVDGTTSLGGLDAGLFFLAYLRDPRTHFIPLQTAMAQQDALMEYLRFTSSAVFAIPPGIGRGEHVGQALFA